MTEMLIITVTMILRKETQFPQTTLLHIGVELQGRRKDAGFVCSCDTVLA